MVFVIKFVVFINVILIFLFVIMVWVFILFSISLLWVNWLIFISKIFMLLNSNIFLIVC